MRLTILTDNFTYIDRYYLGEPAFSALLECGEKTVLFDTGYSDVFMENARRLGLDLEKVTHIVLSHGHNDHTGGLSAFLGQLDHPVELIAHPDVFAERIDNGLEVGSPVSPDDLGPKVTARLSAEPGWIDENVCFLGAIPRKYPFESERAVGFRLTEEGLFPDTVPDDSSLAVKTDEGLFLLTGCAHAGIANTLDHALRVTGETRVKAILGGMHLFTVDGAFEKTAEALSALGTRKVYPCHCTSLAVKAALMRRFEVEETGVGLTIELGQRA